MTKLPAVAIGLAVLASFFDNFAQYPIIAPFARQIGADAALIGVAVAAYSAVNLVGNILAGYLVDRFGTKLLLVFGLIATSGAVLLHTAVQTPAQLIAVRGAHGLAAAVAAPAAFALLGGLHPQSRRGRAMGASGALIAVSALLGPSTGGILGDRLGYSAVFRVVAGVLFVAALFALAFVVEPNAHQQRGRITVARLLGLFARRQLLLAYFAALTLSFGLGILVTTLPLRSADLGFGSTGSGTALSAYALLALLVMASPLSRYGDVRGRSLPIGLGLALCGLSFVLTQQTGSYATTVALMAVFGVGFGLLFPGMTAQVADASEAGERGSAFGIFYAFYSGGVVVGALVAGVVGAAASLGVGAFLVGGVVMFVAGVAYLLIVPRAHAEPSEGEALGSLSAGETGR